jgi:hypothetical protein
MLPEMKLVPAIVKQILQLTYYHRLFRSKKLHEIFSRTGAKKNTKDVGRSGNDGE